MIEITIFLFFGENELYFLFLNKLGVLISLIDFVKLFHKQKAQFQSNLFEMYPKLWWPPTAELWPSYLNQNCNSCYF